MARPSAVVRTIVGPAAGYWLYPPVCPVKLYGVVSASIRFSSDPAELDRDTVFRWLSEESYWAAGRTRTKHDAAIAGSRTYGVYDEETREQLGFARLVTDGATFGWLCDVFVSPHARGRGVGKALMRGILDEIEPLGLIRMGLRTLDAHGLYKQFGFDAIDEPETWMSRTLALE
jgi:GNAT superfamily N-acetyltransferase